MSVANGYYTTKITDETSGRLRAVTYFVNPDTELNLKLLFNHTDDPIYWENPQKNTFKNKFLNDYMAEAALNVML